MNNTVIISHSELDSGQQCEHKHDLQYRQRWVPATTSPALEKGTLFHAAMERHYNIVKEQPILGREVVSDMVKGLFYNDDHTQTELQELVEWMYLGYLDQWWEHDKLMWTILAVEHEIVSPPLPTPGGGRSKFRMKMKLDLIVHQKMGAHKRLLLVDHKSGANLPSEKELEFEDQFARYQWGLKQMKRPVFAIVYNAARTQRNKSFMPLTDRFSRTMLYRTDKELQTVAVESYKLAKRLYANPIGYAPRSPNSDTCRWRCPFTESCLAGRKGIDEVQFMRDKGFRIERERH